MGSGLIAFLAFLGIIIALVMWFVGVYNALVALRNNVDRAWSNIDVLLKQRYDEIPKLVDTCKGYMKYEQETFQRVTEARTRAMNAGTIQDKAQAENMLTSALRSLFAVAENYPELKANTNFLQLQGRVSQIETDIATRRERFNTDTTTYNTRIQQVPALFVAGVLGYGRRDLFQAAAADRADVKVSF